ncbi:AEC family transporter [Planktotalea sp.]|uniref:AEC family transporter n=1 Tax=Planktotalea sp. TaxID=2029877 RepID=UPI003D6BD76E
MSAILTITFPIYAAIAIGYLVVFKGWFAPSAMKVLGSYVLNIALPALLFNAVASRDFAEVFDYGYILIFLIGSLTTLALSFLWFTFTSRDKLRRAVAVFGSGCPNSGFIGYPMMLLILPNEAGVILALNFLVENFFLIPICLILLDLSQDTVETPIRRRLAELFWGILKRPMIIGLLLGVFVSVFQVPMPDAFTRLLQMLSASASAVALVVIGGSLVGLPLKGNRAFASQIAAAKLVLHPAVMGLVLLLFTGTGIVYLPAELQVAVILSAAMPMFSIYPVLAQEYGQEGVASIAMLVATAFAFLTLSGLLLWLT